MRINISPKSDDAYMFFHRGTLAFMNAEETGLRIDMNYVDRKINFLRKKNVYLEEKFKDTKFFRHWQRTSKKPINIDSGTQLAHFLYYVKKLLPPKTTVTGKGAVDADALQQLNIPELNILLERSKIKKTLDVLLGFKVEQVDSIIHPSFNLHLVKTFRSSSNSPNFQNIPKRDKTMMQTVRKAIYPRPGHQFLEIDYSGIEVRIAACYHKDPTMLKYLRDKTTDMHGDMAKQLFKVPNFNRDIPEHYTLRQAAKNGFVFPEFYGSYYKSCAINLACNWGKLPESNWDRGTGIPMPGGITLADHLISKKITSLDSYTEHVRKVEDDFWNNRFKVYARWKEDNWEEYCRKGYIDLLTGFRCSGVMSKNDVSNYGTQGAAFHCLLWSFIELDALIQRKKLDTKLVGQIHDSIILDVHPDELTHIARAAQRIATKELPTQWDWIIVPLEVEMELCPVDQPWSSKEKFSL